MTVIWLNPMLDRLAIPSPFLSYESFGGTTLGERMPKVPMGTRFELAYNISVVQSWINRIAINLGRT